MRINKKERIIWISIVMGLIIIITTHFNIKKIKAKEEDKDSPKEEQKYIQMFEKVYLIIKRHYIEKKSSKELITGAINGMINSLNDPYTLFLVPNAKEELNIETSGEYGGLGIEVAIRDNKLTVISPIEDTPAERAGIMAGDKIIKVNGKKLINPKLSEVVKILRGKPGTKVTISVEREGSDKLIDFTITREIIKIKSVKYSTIGTNMGYIRLVSFRKNAPSEMRKALHYLIDKRKIKGLIFDLRNNPGGLLNVAISIADMFIKKGLIVYTRPRKDNNNPYLNRDYYAHRYNTICSNIPLIVLVNHGSASASEIFSGAIQDDKRGILLGSKTFGKGSVQSVIDLSDGYGLRYTTAYYYTPSGRMIHHKGIEPDIEVDMPILNHQDIENIKKIMKDEIIKKWVKKHKKYNKKMLNDLMNKLNEKGIYLNKLFVIRMLKDELNKLNKKKKIIYDLDYDIQLKEALEILKASINLRNP